MPEFEPGNQHGLATRFPPGQSGNPEGRPEGPSRGTVLRKFLAASIDYKDPSTGDFVTGTMEEAIAMAMLAAASMGDVNAFKAIMDDVYGKATEKQEIILPAKTVIRIGGKRPKPDPAPEAPEAPADAAPPAND